MALDSARAVAVLGGPLGAGWLVRRHLLPSWRGSEGVLATCTLALACLLLVTHSMGAFGGFAVLPLALGGIVVLGFALFAPVRPATDLGVRPGGTADLPMRAAFAVGLAIVVAQWGSRIWSAYTRGMSDYDTLHYHLPHAARFTQLETLTELHFVSADGVPNMFHPSDADVLHALGMMIFDSDVVSPMLNVGWAALGVLAAWCVGRPWSMAPLSALGYLVVLAMPFSAISAGSALSDVPSYTCLLTAAAFLVQADRPFCERAALVAVAAGLALSIKLTMLGPVGALCLGLAWMTWSRRERWTTALAWTMPLLVTGSFWYLRNTIAVGSPLPSLALPGLPRARFDNVERYGFSVANYLDDPGVVRDWFLPGLATGMSVTWPLVGAVVVVTLVRAARRSEHQELRLLAVASGVALAVYLVTPTTALGFDNQPKFFALNLRYAFGPVALALVAAPIVLGRRSATAKHVVTGMLLVLLLGDVLSGRTSPPGYRSAEVRGWVTDHLAISLAGGGFGLALALVVVHWGAIGRTRALGIARRAGPIITAAVGVVVLVAAAAVGSQAEGLYLRHRYATNDIAEAVDGRAPVRVALTAYDLQYPLYGARLQNRVQYVGERTPHGGFDVVMDCGRWRSLVATGGYRYLVLPVAAPPNGPQVTWASTWSAATEVLREDRLVLFELSPDAAHEPCQEAPR